jgi:hypothetical protein
VQASVVPLNAVPNALVITVNEFPGFAEMSFSGRDTGVTWRRGRQPGAGARAQLRRGVLAPGGVLVTGNRDGRAYLADGRVGVRHVRHFWPV